MKEIHEHVHKKLKTSNQQHKQRTYVERRHKFFEEEDLVLAHLRKERFLRGTYTKLKMKKTGPCKIVKKNYNNAYVLELPTEFDIYMSTIYMFNPFLMFLIYMSTMNKQLNKVMIVLLTEITNS